MLHIETDTSNCLTLVINVLFPESLPWLEERLRRRGERWTFHGVRLALNLYARESWPMVQMHGVKGIIDQAVGETCTLWAFEQGPHRTSESTISCNNRMVYSGSYTSISLMIRMIILPELS